MNNTLNVAVATDTILYAPFYLALYGGDFEDTPYGKIDLNIIAQKGNSSFRFNGLPSENADGFVTLALLFGYADIGICDPSFIIQISQDKKNVVLKNACVQFEKSLTKTEKSRFLKKIAEQGFYTAKSKTYNLGSIKEHLKTKPIKVIGGIIKRNAFSVITHKNSNLKEDTEFSTDNFFIFKKPSTGFYYGTSFKNENISKEEIPFGKEFDSVLSVENSCALTCDYIAKNYYENEGEIKTIKTPISNSKSYLFTGILAYVGKRSVDEGIQFEERKNKFKAFTYAIEKNLYIIDRILSTEHINDLNVFFNKKFIRSKRSRFYNNYSELVHFLTSDTTVEHSLLHKTINETIKGSVIQREVKKTEEEIKETVNDFLLKYVELLTEWSDTNNKSGLYYKTLTVDKDDLLNICKYRFKKTEQKNLKNSLNEYIDNSFTDDWNKTQKSINQYSNKWYYKLSLNKNLFVILSIIFAVSSFFSLILQSFNLNFYNIKSIFKIDKDLGIMVNSNTYDISAWVILFLLILLGVLSYFGNKKFSFLESKKEFVFNPETKNK